MLPIVGSIYFCGTSILGHWDTGVLRGLVAFFGNSGCGSGLTASWVLVSPPTNSAAFSASTNSATYVQCPFFFSMCALIAPARVAFSTNLCSIACWDVPAPCCSGQMGNSVAALSSFVSPFVCLHERKETWGMLLLI